MEKERRRRHEEGSMERKARSYVGRRNSMPMNNMSSMLFPICTDDTFIR
jgi:hypothetical protein